MAHSHYDRIAHEYYDEGHITSRNFDAATVAGLPKLGIALPATGLVLDVGAGKGRVGEFLGVDQSRVVQLDSSREMFRLTGREPCHLRVFADACAIPLDDQQFVLVAGFLADPFFGLDFLAEAYRVLCDSGVLLVTLPSYEWGRQLRQQIGIDLHETRFKLLQSAGAEEIRLPSILHPESKLREMLEITGFREVECHGLCLPPLTSQVSSDISRPADAMGAQWTSLQVVQLVKAVK